MSFNFSSNIASGASSTSGSTFELSFTQPGATGLFMLVIIAADNTTTADGDNSEVLSVTDTAGNSYTKYGEYTNGGGGAAAGITTSVWGTILSRAFTVPDRITVTFDGNRVDKCAVASTFSIASGVSIVNGASPITTEVNGANGFGSAAFSGLSSAHRLYFRGMGKEANQVGFLTPTTNFIATAANRSRNHADAVSVFGEFRINTSSGQTSDPTYAVSGDTASVFLALEEDAGGDATATVTGVSATGAVGDFAFVISPTVAITGVSATGAVGTIEAGGETDATAIITGVSAAGAVGDLTAIADASVTPTGVFATGAAGTPAVDPSQAATVSGVAATGAVGSLMVIASADVALTGVSATGAAGDPSITADASIDLTGVSATGAAGTITALEGVTNADVAITGVAGTGAAGTFGFIVSPTITITGVSATGRVGMPIPSISESATLIGVSATMSLGNLHIRIPVVPSSPSPHQVTVSWLGLVEAADPDFYRESNHPVVYEWPHGRSRRE